MKITFVRPNLSNIPSSDAMEPLVFAVLTGLTPPDVELALFDDRLESIPYDDPTDLVAITVETYTARRAYQIGTQFRQRGVPVVMGGFHATFLPQEVLPHADSIVVGDAEGLWPQVVRDVQAGKLPRIYRWSSQPPLNGVKPET
jgi:radical SAM superfamily enzyme YgiQ (UPF0313 family)